MKAIVAMVAAAFLLAAGLTATAAEAQNTKKPAPPSARLLATRQAMRNLWTDHIFWVRTAVVAKHDRNEAAGKAAEAQIVANAHEIAGAVVPFYGKEAGEKLFTLLAGHWGAIKANLDAVDAHNAEAAQKAQDDLYDNAHTIARFLSDANPHWPYDIVNGMLAVHAANHIIQIKDIYSDKYDDEAGTWHQMRMHMNQLGDALADGLAAQFPDKF